MKTILPFLFCVFLLANGEKSNAQLVDVINEVYAESGGIAGVPAGYTTYRIYVRLQDATDRISAVFGTSEPCPIHHLKLGSTESADAIYNSPIAGTFGTDNNCAFWPFFPEMEYDSYVTFQATNSTADACPQCAPTGPILQTTIPAGLIPQTFSTSPLGPDLFLENGSWYIINDGSCFGFPTGVDNRILISQITVPTGTLEYWLNISIFNEAIGADQLLYVHTQQEEGGDCFGEIEIDADCLGLVYPGDCLCASDWPGCTNPLACNYWECAAFDDGSCYFNACTDPSACNYDPFAMEDCGTFEECFYQTQAYAGSDIFTCAELNFALMAANTPGENETGVWTLLMGTGTILNPNDPNAMVTDLNNGENVFQWTIDGFCGTTSDVVSVFVFDSFPQPAEAGMDMDLCNPYAMVTMDAIDLIFPAVGTWTLLSGSGIIADVNDPNTTITGLVLGENIFQWSVVSDPCTEVITDEIAINIYPCGGPCTPPGCPDPEAFNFDPLAGCDDGSCTYSEGADINGDGEINLTDLLLLMGEFGCTADCDPFDLNGDGIVNILDIIFFMSSM